MITAWPICLFGAPPFCRLGHLDLRLDPNVRDSPRKHAKGKGMRRRRSEKGHWVV